jgi:hypothetical protein
MKARNQAASGLVLVGAVHHDPAGYDKLQRVLAAVRPDIITLELSSYGRGFRTKYSRKLSLRIRSHAQAQQRYDSMPQKILPAAVVQLLAAVQFPFEYCAAREYAAAFRVPLYCIDLSRISRRRLRVLKDEALTRSNIATLLALPDKNLLNSVNLCYKRAAAVWNEPGDCLCLPAASDPADSDRDRHMSRRLRNLCAKFPRKRILHIAGWEHCANIAGPLNLYGLLRDLSPQRILLDEAWSDNRSGLSGSPD